ncbi:MAG: hypothetical protein V8Q84_08490 [Bilophila sp.]
MATLREADDLGGSRSLSQHAPDLPLSGRFRERRFTAGMTDKDGCRFDLGCKGPWSGCDSATRKWNGG